MQQPLAEPASNLGQFLQPLSQHRVRPAEPPRSAWSSGNSQSPGTSAARSSRGPPPDARPLAAAQRASPFFPSRSFKAKLSSIESASSFFSLPFSSSSAFSRFASLTSMPPYLALHLQAVASLTPCLRHRSETEIPASCSFRMPPLGRFVSQIACRATDDLIFAEPAAPHLWSFRLGQSLSQIGLDPGGNVSGDHVINTRQTT